jgi:filamentous hemagglutinin family protein
MLLLSALPAQAQIIPDSTLNNPSIATPNGNTVVITGGGRSGSNLFHSFRAFSVPTNGTAFFNNALDVENIITRVTGSNVSNIDGLIRANGSANLFLLNPNGILFGPNASLNIGGSFLATTAEQINFADGTEFSAVNPQPVLTISVPVGLQFGATPGPIRNDSISNPTFDSAGDLLTVDGLRVAPGRTLALLGGPITMPGGVLTAEAGRIEVGSVGASSVVSLAPSPTGWSFGYSGVQRFQPIALSQGSLGGAILDASGTRGGDIHLQGQQIELTDGSAIASDTTGTDAGGTIQIDAAQLTLDGESIISSTTESTGKAADIVINSDRLTLQGGSQIFSSTLADGATGRLTINAAQVDVSDGVAVDNDWFPSGLFTQVAEGATGNGGDLAIATSRLRILGGAQINTTTFGAGRAGNLLVQATSVAIDGSALVNGELFTRDGLPFPSGLFAGTGPNSSGNGGSLTLNAERLSLRNGATLQTATFGSGDAGDLTAIASDFIEVIGTDAAGILPTSLNAASGGITGVVTRGFRDATGRGGTLSIQTGELRIQDGGVVAVGSINPSGNARGAGNLQIQANTVRLDRQSRLLTETASGNGGDINLQVQDLLLLRRNSQISTSAGVAAAGGNGGNITIQANSVVAAPSENSDIRANAFTGTGGNITITAEQVIGITPSDRPTPFSDITASSEFGINGTIQLNTPDVDPNRGLIELPATVVDAASLIAQTCPNGSGSNIATERSNFVITGRGGLPPTPLEPQQPQPLLVGWVAPPSSFPNTPPQGQRAQGRGHKPNTQHPTSNTFPPPSPTPNAQHPTPLLEAQGWLTDSHGEVMLVAEVPTAAPHQLAFTGTQCHQAF